MLLAHTCSVERYASVSTNGAKAYAPKYASVKCLALPMDAKSAIQNEFTIGKAWDVFFEDGADIKTGDQLTINGRTLRVSGVQAFTGLPLVSHIRTMCVEKS